jgi:hypothetical protein
LHNSRKDFVERFLSRRSVSLCWTRGALLAGGGAIFLLATPFLLAALYPQAVHQAGVGVLPQPPPRLQIDPSADLLVLRRAEIDRLSSYGWVDRAPGRAHIPVSRALALIAERGLPGWQKP